MADVARCSRRMGALLCGNLGWAYISINPKRYEETVEFAFTCQEHWTELGSEFEVVPGKPSDYLWLLMGVR